jgi:tRNA (mo5U34)-methyltransferase
MTNVDIEAEVRRLGPWFHNLTLGGVHTAPEHFLGDYPRMKWEKFADALPRDLTGKSVLDVGCNAGFYSMEMKRRGAVRVLGIDSDEHYLRQARFAASVEGLDIEFARGSVYDVRELGERFDLVLFMGVLYHLRYPLLALDRLREVVGEMMVFQSMLRGDGGVMELAGDYPFDERAMFDDPAYPKMFFVERRYANDPTNWWIPNRACAEAMLRSAGFRIIARPEEEVFLCGLAERAPEGEA